ncbi:MAG: glycosyltransferase [Jaaginema sp. PMC 1079.18]|nr:glycosyltransferase [Jaaginema sp. PMC 1080.18]MEC4853904.1 glycosyltransferase [Jaaginema sp. PMC 1079.18]MEC4869156.1 glycosyltransferase [Jaaginema sp. PMC 1078.18]
MHKLPLSVIVCTINRGTFLQRVMQSVSEWRSLISEFIVVVGPVQDNTELVLSAYQNIIDRIIYTKLKNVSVARNLGLYAASEPIILYLDDDVIPSETWIKQHVQAHQQGNWGSVAGIVSDCTQAHKPLQFSQGVSSRWSEDRPVLSARTQSNYLKSSHWFAGVMGANASYKRDVLREIGGFDEFFEYFLEETDVALRLAQAGYPIHYLDVAVEHYVQPSHNRRDRIHLTCWYSLAKNTTYFALKHRLPNYPAFWFWLRLGRVLIYRCGLRVLRLKWTHGLANQVLWEYLQESWCGFKVGLEAGSKHSFTTPKAANLLS